jgi:GNAT superfamily N-acetyltransferase
MVPAMADGATAFEFIPGDLAPGDQKSLELDCSGLEVAPVRSADDPQFSLAYERLWLEFGAQHEMEPCDVIIRRLAWQPATAVGDCWLRYELILVRQDDRFAAVRDHTAIVSREGGGARAVVHLSHLLVDPAWRRTGLAGWLRAWPLQTARACLSAAGLAAASPITLVAEMEHPEPQNPERRIRLAAYEKAGFKKVDPAAVTYFQPDFRPPAQIDASGGPRPLPFGLVLRRVGREQEGTLRGEEVRGIVGCLYHMYGQAFRAQDMAVVWSTLQSFPGNEAEVSLVDPTR